MDTQLFLKINSLAKQTSWAHGFFHEYAEFVGLLVLAAVVATSATRAVLAGRGDDTDRGLLALFWGVVAAAIAFGICSPIAGAIGRARPYVALHGVEVLITKTGGGALPSEQATVAGAIMVALWLGRERALAVLATLAGLLLAFSQVYVGAHYPGDVLAGLGFGAVVVVVGFLPLSGMVSGVRDRQRPTGEFAIHRPDHLGPAADPIELQSTGAVRLLSDRPITPLGSVAARRENLSEVGNS